ncbi:hypothetical protein [Cohnella sp. AR92]|uniref:hypothetical protein n=1 Tax=Cohnella sp. AR92 TaxID=648716 RepID=UPI000F8E4036|nr:hypothetical protein [Cohnella sp. AR92]RUS44912.1 hypothetical protein ELR57_21890 [Cohnella sp. AR92]
MSQQATWLPHSEPVDIIRCIEKAPYGPMVKIRRADGQTMEVNRHEVLMTEDEDLILQLKTILQANCPQRNPAYFSTVKNLLKTGAPLSLATKKAAPAGKQLQMF